MKIQKLSRGDGKQVAYQHAAGRSPTIVFLSGFGSDMTGDKATALAAFCAARGQAFLRFDYLGHGASGGAFTDGTIGIWTEDALAVIDHAAPGPLLLVGSSMGGWIALLVALARPDRVAGLVGVAAAPDFTKRLMWDALMPPERGKLLREGLLHIPSTYGPPTPITARLIDEGRRHLLLDGPIALGCPVRLLHGQRDADVPWETALTLAAAITGADVQVTLVKDGEHRLSRPSDLASLGRIVGSLLGENGG